MKKVLLLSIVMLSFLILILPVFAEQTVKTVEIPIGFVAQTTTDTDYITTITIKPPDGVEQIISFEIFVQGDFQSSTNIITRVRKTGNSEILSCVPSAWTTPSIDTPNYEASFDCSSLAYKYDFTTGKIDVGFRTSKIAQNVKGFARMTYYNNPSYTVTVFGTEYNTQDSDAKVFLQILDNLKMPVTNATCYMSIYNPNTTLWINQSLMGYVNEGLHHLDVYIYNKTEGNYMASAYCTIPQTVNITAYDDFECGAGNCYSDLDWTADWTLGSHWSVSTYGSPRGSYHLRGHFDEGSSESYRPFNNSDCETGYLTFWTKSYIDEYGYCNYYYYDGSSNNLLLSLTSDTSYSYRSYEVCSTYGTSSNARIRVYGHNDEDTYCYLDDINFTYQIDYNETEYQFVRGSGEIHINDWFGNISVIDALASFDEAKFVGATEYETGDEGRFMVQYIKTVAGSPSPENGANCTVNVTYPNGTLYLTNYQLDYLAGSNGIYEKTFTVPDTVGVYTADYYCYKAPKSVYGSDTFHVSYPINTTSISENVWEYPTRNLTYYPPFDYEQMAQYVWNFSNRTVNLTEVIEEIRSVNSSIFTKLHLIQDDIENLNNLSAEEVWTYSNRTVNLTEILDFLYAMNASIQLRLDEIEQIILDFNASIHIEVDNLANLSASEVWSYFNRTLTDYNQSELIALLNQTQNFILNLNNLSASNVWEYPIRNLTYINFTEVLDRIDLANNTIIGEILSVNASIWTKLFLIQDELAFINDTTIETNWIVKNLTLGNITLTTDINWTRLRIEVWNKSSNEKLTHDVLSFADDEVQLVITTQFCQDNTTLVYQHNVSRSILGFEYDDNFQETEICTYGCYNNECRQPPWIIYGIIFLLVLVISALIFYFSRGAEEGLQWGYK